MGKRAIAYVDGFNLYKGCLEGTPWKWLDLVGLMEDLAGRKHGVDLVNYFTARVDERPDTPGQSQRQDALLRALRAHCRDRLNIVYGHFRTHEVRRRLVKALADGTEFVHVYHTTEKASDVNLGAQLVWDACHDEMQVGLVVSNDSDLQTPVDMARHSGCHVIVVNPQILDRRNAGKVRRQRPSLVGDDTRRLTIGRLRKNQMPNPVKAPDGRDIHCPPSWLPADAQRPT